MIFARPGSGWRQRSVVTDPMRTPTARSTSAESITSRVSIVPPLLPTTPRAWGSVSGIAPWPLIVVATGAPRRRARRAKAVSAPAMTGPPPQSTNGRSAAARRSAAVPIASGSGPARRAGNRPSSSSAWMSVSSTGWFWTSNGKPRCAAPGRPVVMALKASRTRAGRVSARCAMAFHLVTGRNRASWSSSVRVKRPRPWTDMSEVMASTGIELSFASANPGRM